jgi:hypothetical protein
VRGIFWGKNHSPAGGFVRANKINVEISKQNSAQNENAAVSKRERNTVLVALISVPKVIEIKPLVWLALAQLLKAGRKLAGKRFNTRPAFPARAIKRDSAFSYIHRVAAIKRYGFVPQAENKVTGNTQKRGNGERSTRKTGVFPQKREHKAFFTAFARRSVARNHHNAALFDPFK